MVVIHANLSPTLLLLSGEHLESTDIVYVHNQLLHLLLIKRLRAKKETPVPMATSEAPNLGLRSTMADCDATLQLTTTPRAASTALHKAKVKFIDHSRIVAELLYSAV